MGRQVTCDSTNIKYLIQCDKDNCRKQYIGVTAKEFCEIIYQHFGYVRNKVLSRAQESIQYARTFHTQYEVYNPRK